MLNAKLRASQQRYLQPVDACRDKGMPLSSYCGQAGLGLAQFVLKPLASLYILPFTPPSANLTMLWHIYGMKTASLPANAHYCLDTCNPLVLDNIVLCVVRMLQILDLNPSNMVIHEKLNLIFRLGDFIVS